MNLDSTGFRNGESIPEQYCFCRIDPETHVSLSDNRNPQLSWSDAPVGTKTFVLLCMDVDVPTIADDVNQEGRTVAHDLPRCEFCHWVMVDIPADCLELDEAGCCDGVTPRGKKRPPGPSGTRQGINNYKEWFTGDADMGGDYHGYDGPCPPWNDERLHHYRFTMYAIDLERCPVEGDDFRAEDVLHAIEGHVLDTATLTGTCTLNPELAARS
ncbi:MAG: YbhB/YbcL family Raf kinase inhibitor-like protein [Phycisphaerales bacterium]|nr:YbhB/YbcL family Raf kinase inhibitor-like protein [Phycisphaerales bacterium]